MFIRFRLVFINSRFVRGVVWFMLMWLVLLSSIAGYFISNLSFVMFEKNKFGCFSPTCLNTSIYNITINMLKRNIKIYWRQQRMRLLIWYEGKLNGLILCKIQFKYLSNDRYIRRFHDNIMNFSKGYCSSLHHLSLKTMIIRRLHASLR